MSLKIGIVVGENSGDNLAANLITALKTIDPNIEVAGIAGPKLMEIGCQQLIPMKKIAIMGFVEPLLRLFELYKLRKWLIQYFIDEPIDLFIGVDAPDFNLGLEKQLKKAGIPTVHYVSPSVWAWREGRINTIKKAVDLMLTLFPFEESYYLKHNIPVKFVGHPAADKISTNIDTKTYKLKLGYKETDRIITLMPGSRNSEIKHMAKLYLQVAKLCQKKYPELKIIVPVVSLEHQVIIEKLQLQVAGNTNIHITVGKAYDMISASDIVLVTSGTATLEVMLHNKPMVIAYKTNFLTYEIVKRLIKVPFIGLPNLLSNAGIVPELIQKNANPQKIAKEIILLLENPLLMKNQTDKFSELHITLAKQAGNLAASSIANMLGIKDRHSQ